MQNYDLRAQKIKWTQKNIRKYKKWPFFLFFDENAKISTLITAKIWIWSNTKLSTAALIINIVLYYINVKYYKDIMRKRIISNRPFFASAIQIFNKCQRRWWQKMTLRDARSLKWNWKLLSNIIHIVPYSGRNLKFMKYDFMWSKAFPFFNHIKSHLKFLGSKTSKGKISGRYKYKENTNTWNTFLPMSPRQTKISFLSDL